MINEVCYRNFQGQSNSHILGKLTLVSGPNGSGKSTLRKAIQMAVQKRVPSDRINKDAHSQFEAYCSRDAGEMEIQVVTDLGLLSRLAKKTRGKVTFSNEFTGKAIPARTDHAELLQNPVFDASGFWSLSSSEQVGVLCDLAGVDQKVLDKINKKISQKNTEKKNLMTALGEAKNALKDHERELQDKIEEAKEQEDVNLEDAYKRIDDIEKSINDIDYLLNSIVEAEARAESIDSQIKDLNSRSAAVAEELEGIVIPEEVIDTDKLKAEIKTMDSIRMAKQRADALDAKIKRLESRKKPIAPTQSEEDITALQEMIVKAESGLGLSDEDKIGYEIGKKFCPGFGNHLNSIGLEEEAIQHALVYVREFFGPYKDRVLEANESSTALGKVSEWRREASEIQNSLDRYRVESSEYELSQAELMEAKEEKVDLEDVEFSEEEYQKALMDLASRNESAGVIQSRVNRRQELIETANEIANKLSILTDKKSENFTTGNKEELATKKESLQAEYKKLRSAISLSAEVNQLEKIVSKKNDLVESNEELVKVAKTEEANLRKEKSQLLESVEKRLGERAGRITAPARLSFEIPDNPSEKVKFFLEQTNGEVTERATLCGAEQVEFDLALAFALVGEGGTVFAETSELTEDRVNELIKKLSGIENNIQVILVGHNLRPVPSKPGLEFIYMEKSKEAS